MDTGVPHRVSPRSEVSKPSSVFLLWRRNLSAALYVGSAGRVREGLVDSGHRLSIVGCAGTLGVLRVDLGKCKSIVVRAARLSDVMLDSGLYYSIVHCRLLLEVMCDSGAAVVWREC